MTDETLTEAAAAPAPRPTPPPMMTWITNGTVARRVPATTALPAGWARGGVPTPAPRSLRPRGNPMGRRGAR